MVATSLVLEAIGSMLGSIRAGFMSVIPTSSWIPTETGM